MASGVLAARDPDRYAFLLFSWIRGIAALVTSGIAGPDAPPKRLCPSFVRQKPDKAGAETLRATLSELVTLAGVGLHAEVVAFGIG
jgi:hypothetical protein